MPKAVTDLHHSIAIATVTEECVQGKFRSEQQYQHTLERQMSFWTRRGLVYGKL